MELVVELRDRQRNSFAQTTFSEAVQCEMENNGDREEPLWWSADTKLVQGWTRVWDEHRLMYAMADGYEALYAEEL